MKSNKSTWPSLKLSQNDYRRREPDTFDVTSVLYLIFSRTKAFFDVKKSKKPYPFLDELAHFNFSHFDFCRIFIFC